MSSLLIGIGQPFRSDDALGRVALEMLRPKLASMPVELRESTGDGMQLMELWKGASKVVVLDAISSGRSPGTILRLDPHEAELPAEFFVTSTHLWGLAEAIEMSRVLGLLPREMVVFGVEGHSFSYGDALSPQVQAALPGLLERVVDEWTPAGAPHA